MFVLQAQAVEFKSGRRAGLVSLDHLAAATGVAGDGRQAEREIGRHQAGIDQRADQRNRAGGVAARVGHALGRHHCFALAADQLGKTKHPARRSAVRAGGVNDFGYFFGAGLLHAVDHGNRLSRRVVVEAQNHQIGLRHQRAFGCHVLAQFRCDAEQVDLRHGL